MNLKNDFLKKNKINLEKAQRVLNKTKKDKNGNIIIQDGHFVISKTSVSSYSFTDSWILLSQPGVLNREGIQGRMALVKSYVSDKCPEYFKGVDAEMTMANNFILPEIAKQFQLESAEYYNVVFEDGDELQSDDNFKKMGRLNEQKIKPGKKYLLSPSFVKTDEELVHFADILENSRELTASKIIAQTESYLKRRKIPETDIEAIRQEFIKQCIFNRFIDFSDEHNLNSGIVFTENNQERRARLTPCYDLDFSAGVYNTANGGFLPRTFFRTSDDGGNDLLSILQQFKGDFEKIYLNEIIPKINIEEAIKKGEEYGNFKLSEIANKRYQRFFKTQIKDLQDFYKENYIEGKKEAR